MLWGFFERNEKKTKTLKYKGNASALISAMCHFVALLTVGEVGLKCFITGKIISEQVSQSSLLFLLKSHSRFFPKTFECSILQKGATLFMSDGMCELS